LRRVRIRDRRTSSKLSKLLIARPSVSWVSTTKRCADIADKDAWLNTKKRVLVRRFADTSLLKKMLKIHDKTKAKSEKGWSEGIEGVKHSREMKQKKRDANL